MKKAVLISLILCFSTSNAGFLDEQQQKCLQKNSLACATIAEYYARSITPNLTKARDFYKLACNLGRTYLCETYKLLDEFSGVQPNYYPPKVVEHCKAQTLGSDHIKQDIECLKARNDYLLEVLKETSQKALASIKDEKRRKELEELSKWTIEDPYYSQDLEKLFDLPTGGSFRDVLNGLIYGQQNLIEANNALKVAMLPEEIRTSKDPEKLVKTNYEKALSSSKYKEAIEKSQKQWLANRYEICYANPAFLVPYVEFDDKRAYECALNWDRVRAAELAGLAEEK